MPTLRFIVDSDEAETFPSQLIMELDDQTVIPRIGEEVILDPRPQPDAEFDLRVKDVQYWFYGEEVDLKFGPIPREQILRLMATSSKWEGAGLIK